MFIQEDIKCYIQFADSTNIYEINEDDIIDEDVSITSQCCDDNTFSLGGVYSSQLTMTFRASNFETNIYDIRGAKITVYTKYDMETKFILRGTFWVTSANRQKDIFNISASDSLIWLDNIPTTERIADALTLHLETYLATLTYQARRIILGTNAMLLGMPCSTADDIGNSIKYLENDSSNLIFDYEYPKIFINNTIRGRGFRHFHKDGMSVETSPREHIGFLAQIYGGFAYSKANGNISFGKFFRNGFDDTDVAFDINKNTIEIDTLDVSDRAIKISPVKQIYNNGYSQWHYYTSMSPNELYSNIILDNNPYLDGYYVENESIASTDCEVITQTLFRILNGGLVTIGNDYAVEENIECITYIRPFSLKCHTQHRFFLGEHVLIPSDKSSYESVLTKIVWTFRGGYELSCTGGDTRMLSESYKNSQAKKVQRLIERKINYYR